MLYAWCEVLCARECDRDDLPDGGAAHRPDTLVEFKSQRHSDIWHLSIISQ